MRDTAPLSPGAMEYACDIAELERELAQPTLSIQEVQSLHHRLNNVWAQASLRDLKRQSTRASEATRAKAYFTAATSRTRRH